jgi:2-iminobutanoate/2-iminopropanoate deaminase
VPRQVVNSSRLSTPVGPLAHAVRSGDLVYLSGQVGLDPATGALADGGFIPQTRQTFSNVRVLLDDVGLDLDSVVKVNVFLTSMGDFAALNAVYAEQFAAPYPARTTVAVKELPLGALVELEMIARIAR